MPSDLLLTPATRGHIRHINVRRDLGAIADLVEMCFYDTLDPDGRRYLQEMRRAAQNSRLLGWASDLYQEAPTPPSGYVWEEDGRLVGNLSLIPINVQGRHCYLIANVSVHPDFRGRGIAWALTMMALEYMRNRQTPAAWLQVRDDNPIALDIYHKAGFKERARRTSWYTSGDVPQEQPIAGIVAGARRMQDWPLQRQWLAHMYPAELAWHLPVNWRAIRPDVWGMAYRFMMFDYPRQWAVLRDGQLQGTLTWRHGPGVTDPLWLAIPDEPDETAVRALLVHARRQIPKRQPLMVNCPAGLVAEALRGVGFYPHQTLIWMEYRFS